MQETNLKIKERFDAEKIEFAFPTQTIYLKNEAAK
jgi:small-conductance mechanosensitive channel